MSLLVVFKRSAPDGDRVVLFGMDEPRLADPIAIAAAVAGLQSQLFYPFLHGRSFYTARLVLADLLNRALIHGAGIACVVMLRFLATKSTIDQLAPRRSPMAKVNWYYFRKG